MANSMIPAGDFRTSYAVDTTIFPTVTSRNVAIASVVLICFAPYLFNDYWLSLLISIGIYGIAALGLNVLVGFTGQISIGHAAFFLFGAFSSAYLSTKLGVPAFFAIPLAGLATALVGLVFGLPAARLKGLYLAIATLAAQYILLDFFARAEWFSGGSVPAMAEPFSIFGYVLQGDRQFFYVVLAYVVVCFLLVTNMMRSRDGRALVAVRDHYLSAEIMGINLTKCRTLSFGIAAFFAGVGGEWAAKNGGVTGENVKKALYQKKDWVPAGMEGVCNPSTWTEKDHRGTLTVDLYRSKVSGATEGDLNDLMKKGTIKLEKVKIVELPRKAEWLGW